MGFGALIDHFAVLSCHIGSNERICVAAARCTKSYCDTGCSGIRTLVGYTRVLGSGPACTARKNRHQRTILHNFQGKNPESDESVSRAPVRGIWFRGNPG